MGVFCSHLYSTDIKTRVFVTLCAKGQEKAGSITASTQQMGKLRQVQVRKAFDTGHMANKWWGLGSNWSNLNFQAALSTLESLGMNANLKARWKWRHYLKGNGRKSCHCTRVSVLPYKDYGQLSMWAHIMSITVYTLSECCTGKVQKSSSCWTEGPTVQSFLRTPTPWKDVAAQCHS